jgi:peptidyl-dipeptidase A
VGAELGKLVRARTSCAIVNARDTACRYNTIPGIVPYADAPSPPDATPFMKQKGFTSRQVVRTAERFFRSLGMRELPPSFWNSSLFDQPLPPREAVCHASAWDFTNGAVDDARLKMCVEITEEDLVTAHHELGHIYYFLAYKEQPFPFRTGANDGFHEGIGDTLALSCTTAYLRQIGILPPALSPDPKLELQARVNSLMKMALDKIAFLPFGFAVDAYRCSTPVAVSVKMSLTCLQMERLQWQRAALILHIQLVEAASAVPGHRSCTASF